MSDASTNTEDTRTITRRGALSALAIGVSVPAMAGCISIRRERDQETVTRRFDAGLVESVRISNPDGDLRLEETHGDSIRIRATKYVRGEYGLGDVTLETTHSGNQLTISSTFLDDQLFGSGWVDLTVEIPDTVAVSEATVDDGDVTIDAVGGNTSLRVSDGDIVARRATGDLNVTAEDGDIAVRQTSGSVTAQVNDGDIDIRNPGQLGDIVVEDGDIHADLPAVTGDTMVEATDGNILLRLGDDLDARIVADTDDGEVRGVSSFDDVESATETHVQGVLGNGTGRVTVFASDGDITIR